MFPITYNTTFKSAEPTERKHSRNGPAKSNEDYILTLLKAVEGSPWSKKARKRRIRLIKRLIETLPPEEVALYEDEVQILFFVVF